MDSISLSEGSSAAGRGEVGFGGCVGAEEVQVETVKTELGSGCIVTVFSCMERDRATATLHCRGWGGEV